jgi:YspA, cpYpsA-related SLOG family
MRIYKVLICGDRNYKTEYAEVIQRVLLRLKREHGHALLIIAGGAKGVDTLVDQISYEKDIHCAVVRALWSTRRKGAGPQRNKVMLAMKPHEVIGIHANWDESSGTEDMCSRAEEARIPTERITVKANG